LKPGDGVAEGVEIESGRGSHATLEFTGRTVVRIKSDSRLVIDVHRASAALATEFETRLQLISGALEASVAAQRAPNFSIASPSGSIAVRAADLRARSGDGAMLVEVMEGSVAVAGTAGGQVTVDAGYGTRVKSGEAPLAPVKLLAAPDISGAAQLQRRPVARLRFAPLAGAERYRIVTATDRDLRDVVVENTLRRPDARMVDLRDGEYFYGVRAIDALGLEGTEARGGFRLKARPLPPTPQAPAPGAALEPGAVIFSWAAVAEAVSYRFQLATDEAFAAPLVNREGLLVRELEVEKLEAGRYYWRVATVIGGNDRGPFGEPQVLTLQAPAPQTP
jgi:hypothetical protein